MCSLRRFITFSFFLSVLFFSCSSFASESGTLSGKIVDMGTRVSLTKAKVTIEKTKLFSVTDKEGGYRIVDIPAGTYTVKVQRKHYYTYTLENVVIEKGKGKMIDFELSRIPEPPSSSGSLSGVIAGAPTASGSVEGFPSGKPTLGAPSPSDLSKEIVQQKGRAIDKSEPGKEKVLETSGKPSPPTTASVDTTMSVGGAAFSTTPTSMGEPAAPVVLTPPKQKLKAASHDDNEEFPYFLEFLAKNKNLRMTIPHDSSTRYIIRIVDGNNKPVLNKDFEILDENSSVVWKAKTYANGENIFFPSIMAKGVSSEKFFLKTTEGANVFVSPLEKKYQNLNTLQFNALRADTKPLLDVLFILDTTGSMQDEINALKDTIFSVYTRILKFNPNLDIQLGMVLYRDKGDAYIIREFNFTSNIDTFQTWLNPVMAGGGGDGPEDLQSALECALKKLSWRANAIKLGFVIADAEPHTDYGQEYTYLDAAKDANATGIKLYMIGASGLNLSGEYIFRQIAAFTYSQFIFLTYGETGESEGTDTGKVSHHTGANYQSSDLDDLVFAMVKKELSYQMKKEDIQAISVKPEEEKEHLHVRLDNLWQQIYKQLHLLKSHPASAVLFPFDAEDENLKELKQFLSDMSLETLVANHGLKMIEREKLELVLKEQAISLSGLTEQSEEYSRVGKLLNSDIIFSGRMYYMGLDRVLHVRAIQVQTGQILAAARVRI